MPDIDLDKPGQLTASGKNVKDFTFLLVRDQPAYEPAALERNPDCVAADDLFFKSEAVPAKAAEVALDLKPHAKAIRDKLKDGKTAGKIVVIATAKPENRDPKRRVASVETCTLKRKIWKKRAVAQLPLHLSAFEALAVDAHGNFYAKALQYPSGVGVQIVKVGAGGGAVTDLGASHQIQHSGGAGIACKGSEIVMYTEWPLYTGQGGRILAVAPSAGLPQRTVADLDHAPNPASNGTGQVGPCVGPDGTIYFWSRQVDKLYKVTGGGAKPRYSASLDGAFWSFSVWPSGAGQANWNGQFGRHKLAVDAATGVITVALGGGVGVYKIFFYQDEKQAGPQVATCGPSASNLQLTHEARAAGWRQEGHRLVPPPALANAGGTQAIFALPAGPRRFIPQPSFDTASGRVLLPIASENAILAVTPTGQASPFLHTPGPQYVAVDAGSGNAFIWGAGKLQVLRKGQKAAEPCEGIAGGQVVGLVTAAAGQGRPGNSAYILDAAAKTLFEVYEE